MKEIRNVKITEVFLGFEDHGIFTCIVRTTGDCVSQSFGCRSGEAAAIKLVKDLLKLLEKDNFNQLVGEYLKIEADYTHVYRVSHILKDKWIEV